MKNIVFEEVSSENIELCRDLCNELMLFQKEKAIYHKENFDTMNFDTRMKLSFNNALEKQVIIAKSDNEPVGYIFSTIDEIKPEERNYFPDWAPKEKNSIGFYPEWVELPQKIGCLNNLYIKEKHRGLKIGDTLFEKSIEWFQSFKYLKLLFVYISNGNKEALDFYLNRGFTYSHDVFGKFITAAYRS